MIAIARNDRILALAVLGAAASLAAQAQTAAPANPAAPPAAASQATPEGIEACMVKTTALLDALDKGDYASAGRDFNAQVRAGAPADKLKTVWESLPQKFGARGSRGAAQNGTSNGYIVITVPLAFQNGNLAAQVACGADGKIAGFHVMLVPAVPAAAGS